MGTCCEKFTNYTELTRHLANTTEEHFKASHLRRNSLLEFVFFRVHSFMKWPKMLKVTDKIEYVLFRLVMHY